MMTRANVIEVEPRHAAQPVVVVVMPAQQAGDGGPVYDVADVQDAGEDAGDAQIDVERIIARSLTVSAALCLALLIWR